MTPSERDAELIERLRERGVFAWTVADGARLLALAERGLSEREDVCAWLRERAVKYEYPGGAADAAADAIERGAHVGAAAKARL
jgi:hypothetical protein